MTENMTLQEKIAYCAKLKGKAEPDMPTEEEYKKLTKQLDDWNHGTQAEQKMVNHAMSVSIRGQLNKTYPPGYAISPPAEIKTALKAEIHQSLPEALDSELDAIASVHLEQIQDAAYRIVKYSVTQKVNQIKAKVIQTQDKEATDTFDKLVEEKLGKSA